MASGYVVKINRYYDSVFLMRVAKRLADEPGVTQSAVLMGTDANKEMLAEIGLTGLEIETASSNDLVVGIISEDAGLVNRLLQGIDEYLNAGSGGKKEATHRSLENALNAYTGINLVVVSTPGEYAAREARKALEARKNVFLFSDNVPLDQEVELKELAKSKGRLLMGPDCGTSLIGGIGIGFANHVRKGAISAVGASGTGLQEFTSLVHQSGAGISHAIGTGSHDLSDAVGGVTTLMALDALESDGASKVIAIVSKPAGKNTLAKLEERIRLCRKQVVGCFLGLDESLIGWGENFRQAGTIDDAVIKTLELTGQNTTPAFLQTNPLESRFIQEQLAGYHNKQRYIRGLFAGGTFCYQAQQVLRRSGIPVYSNAPLEKRFRLTNPLVSVKHSLVDMGDDMFTRGKPHPMIDAGQRRKRILEEAADPEVAILLLDFILGEIASRDPAGDLLPAIEDARRQMRLSGGSLTVVASICGTDQDAQDLERQRELLQNAGVIVFSSNYQASSFCAQLQRLLGESDGKK